MSTDTSTVDKRITQKVRRRKADFEQENDALKAEIEKLKAENVSEDKMKEKVKKWHQKNGGWDKDDEENYDAFAEIKSHIDFVTFHLDILIFFLWVNP